MFSNIDWQLSSTVFRWPRLCLYALLGAGVARVWWVETDFLTSPCFGLPFASYNLLYFFGFMLLLNTFPNKTHMGPLFIERYDSWELKYVTKLKLAAFLCSVVLAYSTRHHTSKYMKYLDALILRNRPSTRIWCISNTFNCLILLYEFNKYQV